MRKIISLICLLLPIASYADQLSIRENAPDQYVVVKGDTLWDISAKFFKDPWKWTEIWGLNKNTIKDPHWIYPGDVVALDKSANVLHVIGSEVPIVAKTTNGGSASNVVTLPVVPSASNLASKETIKLSPMPHVLRSNRDAIPVIPLKDIGPFLDRPLVVDEDSLSAAPILVGTYEQRVLLGTDDIAYVSNLPNDKGLQWQVYRTGKMLKDFGSNEILGIEVSYLGDAAVETFGEPSTLRITRAVQEISKGDRFAQTTTGFAANYVPHAPENQINAKVLSIYGGVLQAGQNSIITLNKGQRDGVESGQILALYQKGEVLNSDHFFSKNNLQLPDVRYGLVFVFRVFNKVSYGLVLETSLPVQIEDTARTP